MDQLLEKIEDYVRTLFREHYDESLFFHNLGHTQKVVSRTKEIGEHLKVSAEEAFQVTAAAWFHDVGYLFVRPSEHEAKSTETMLDFMRAKGADESKLSVIASCIMATKFPVHPEGTLQKILCDADTYHFGTSEFIESNEKVFLELRMKTPGLDKEQYKQGTVSMLLRHEFYTPYCEELLQTGKQRNIDRLILDYY